jgi:hypothetical protein
MREAALIDNVIGGLPDDNTVLKMVSLGGFSSIGLIRYIADRTIIHSLTASTLRVGAKHLQALDVMHSQGRLEHVRFVIGSVQMVSKAELAYSYYDKLIETSKRNNWEVHVKSNHSKLLLFNTESGKFVVETSSNLNENPTMEQFSFCKCAELHDFYSEMFDELLVES